MTDLRFAQVDARPASGDLLRDWRFVHNAIIPTHLLTPDEVRERAGRNLLEVAYDGDTLVGCSTVRPPSDEEPVTATVIARVLPAHRGRGFGGQLYARGLEAARKLGGEVIETVVLASNTEGVRFARAHGFETVEEYLLPGGTIPWFTLRLA